MPVFNHDIRKLAKSNIDFHHEILTNAHNQVVLRRIQSGDDISEEVHGGIDRLLVLVNSEGEVRLDGMTSAVGKGSQIPVPAGTRHNLVNTGGEPIRPYTVYAPLETAPGTVHTTKADAFAAEPTGPARHAPCPDPGNNTRRRLGAHCSNLRARESA